MHKLQKFFEAKIASKLRYRVTTGDLYFPGVYARHYQLEVVSADDNGAEFLVTSFDVTPSGVRAAGSIKGFGTVMVPFSDSVESMVRSAVVGSDPALFEKYNYAPGVALA